MAENRLPNGVGKKIVQALKKQAEIEIQPISDSVEKTNPITQEKPNLSPEFYSSEITDNVSLEDNFSDFSLDNGSEDSMSSFDEDIAMDDNSFESSFPGNVSYEAAAPQMFEQDEIFNKSAVNMSSQKS